MSRIAIVTPAPVGSLRGNRVTAERYRELLEEVGHDVTVDEEYRGAPCDVLFALHARRSAPSVARYRAEHPAAPLIVVMTGTDLYGDLPRGDEDAFASLEAADRIVVLHPRGAEDLPARLRPRATGILQSVGAVPSPERAGDGRFHVCVVGHLRDVKDPLLAARAARSLPAGSRVSIEHLGRALTDADAAAAHAEQRENPRYTWLGEVPRERALARLAGADLHVLTSKVEGGANALCEAIACDVPSLSTAIASSIGILGADYPGLFPVGDADALASLLQRAESDAEFRADLVARGRRIRPSLAPEHEREALAALVAELVG